ncbi:unnamed protein product [Hyaloperonospora brassicae]|uniref:RxLR effector candidate protein n=1 Tax=Hyaloperonospora brassicae TaxID=162125 RepID=A0AAV0U0Q9_HYABA|nr:unnamed protein product [Hyaloperonospora brassicae]
MVARNALRAVVFAALAMGVSILDARVVSRKLVEMRSTSTTSASLPTSRESTKPKSFALADLDTLGTNDDDGDDDNDNDGDDGEDHTRNSGAAPKKGAKEAVALSRRDDKAKTNASAGTNSGTATRDVFSRRKGESTSSGASSRDETEVGTTSKTGNRSAASEEKETEKKRDSRSRDPFSREVDLSPEDGDATRKDAPHKRSKKNNDDGDDDGDDDDDDDDKDASYRLPKSQREAQAEARHKAQAERRAKREAQKKVWRKIKEQERAEREAAKARARSDTSAIQAAAGGKRNSTATKEQQK